VNVLPARRSHDIPAAKPSSRRSRPRSAVRGALRAQPDPRLAVHRATWARDHALGLVAHLNSIGKAGEAAAAANIAGALGGVLRELPSNPEGWRPDTPYVRVVP
jgi:hypothetical protein